MEGLPRTTVLPATPTKWPRLGVLHFVTFGFIRGHCHRIGSVLCE